MPRYIIHRNGAFNEYTTVADGACWEAAMSEDDLKRLLGPVAGAEDRFERAKATGCSAHFETLESCVAGNRAGPNETELPFDEFIRRFLTLPNKDPPK